MIFDLYDNVLVCNWKNKLKQIKYGGCESRDIELDYVCDLYNVIFYLMGEKMMIFGYSYLNDYFVYEIVQIFYIKIKVISFKNIIYVVNGDVIVENWMYFIK